MRRLVYVTGLIVASSLLGPKAGLEAQRLALLIGNNKHDNEKIAVVHTAVHGSLTRDRRLAARNGSLISFPAIQQRAGHPIVFDE